MVVEPINNKCIKIKLSNTESVGQNIYKYTSFDKQKETKSKSSTCNYFLTTNKTIAKELLNILNDFNKQYYLDVNKTRKCIFEELCIIKDNDLEKEFKGNLSPLYTSNDYFKYNNSDFVSLGIGMVKLDQGGKYNLYFDNTIHSVEMFRSAVIGVLSDINIEVTDNKYIIYPLLKDEIPFNKHNQVDNLDKIIELARELNNGYNEKVIKEIILLGYKLLNK